MPSRRQIWVKDVPIGGGAPVAVQSMTKTETADYDATMRQIRAIADAGAGGTTEEALAQRLDYNLRYVQVCCRGAYAFELLDWDEQSGYRLAPYMEPLLLDPSDPQFIGGAHTVLHCPLRGLPSFPRVSPDGRCMAPQRP